ncbi:MAG: YegS/Rv2252/BmrU family lipid kinase [Crocinitomicaceae bacterium]
MKPSKNILFLLNPISGIGEKGDVPDLVKQYLTDHKHELRFTAYRKHGEEIANAEKKNFDAIVAIGGDGTVNEIAGALANSDCALGVIPAGSGNGLARHLKIPLNIKSAIERINSFEPSLYDTGTVNKRFFAGTCGFGFDAYIAELFDKYPKRGFLSYAKLIAREYAKYQPLNFNVEIEGQQIQESALICAVANSSQFGNGFTISPDSKMDDQLFEMVMIKKFPFINTMAIGTRFFTQSINASKHFNSTTFNKTISVAVENQDKHYFHLDGEPLLGNGHYEIQLNAANLKIL